MTDAHTAPETKANTTIPQADDYSELMHAFEEFKSTNDKRLDEIERKHSADVLIEEKVERLNRVISEQKQALLRLSQKAASPMLDDGMSGAHHPINPEHKSAFNTYLRTGEVGALGLMEMKSMSADSNTQGGYTVPLDLDTMIGTRLKTISPIRQIATVIESASGTYRKPFASTSMSAGWVAETAARSQSTTPTLANIDVTPHEIYAMPGATQTLLDDTSVDLESWIVSEVEAVFATQEGTAFVAGDGSGKPKGFLSYTTVDEASWSWGNIGTISTGDADNFATTNPADSLLDLVYALKAGYRQNAHFVMNRKTESVIRKFKDADGNYLWTPPSGQTTHASLFNFPIIDAEDMPDVGVDTTPIAFGDFARGYVIVDRVGTRVLRDPFSAKPYVLFYVTKRVGGAVQDFDAIKLLKCAL